MPSYIAEIKVISLIKLLNIMNMKIHNFISVGVGHQEGKGCDPCYYYPLPPQ